MTHFTDDEMNLICIYDTQNRNVLIMDMERAMPYIKDTELKKIVLHILDKLQQMTDQEFNTMDFKPTVDFDEC